MRRASMDAAYFRDLYEGSDGDPWQFATSDYEREKYDATIAALPRHRYARALEIGCSIGVMSQMLASRCDALLATEPAERAREQARVRCADLPNVEILPLEAPANWPPGPFDLIVLSEVVYYFTRPQIRQLADRVRETLTPDGEVMLVHWIRETDYPLSGDEAVATFLIETADCLRLIRQERTADYRLDLCARSPERVPAAAG